MRTKIFILLISILIGGFIFWYFDIGHDPIEQVNELIGENFDYAHKLYFKTNPDHQVSFQLKDAKDEFRGAIQNYANILKDSTVYEYTWNFTRYNVTIWVGKTASLDHQVIDAIRWQKDVQF